MYRLHTNVPQYSDDILDEMRLFPEEEAELDVRLECAECMRCTITFRGVSERFADDLPCGDDLTVKRLTKRFLKGSVYRVLSAVYGARPWGSLTGVRPTKLAYEWLKRGKRSELVAFLTQTFLVSERKARTIARIIDTQQPYLTGLENAVNLYVHIPFCNGRCNYCSFPSADAEKNKKILPVYVRRLCEEIFAVRRLIAAQKKEILSVYIGGGTPSVLTAEEISAVLEAVGVRGKEITFEAGRPDSIDAEKIDAMKRGGVNRICINPQTLNDATLARIGRRHTTEQFYTAFGLARNAGFVVNTDLIAGLEGESLSDFCRTLDGILALQPQNITVHTLSRKRGSELAEKILCCDTIEAMTDTAYDRLSERYEPYYLYRQKNMLGNLENLGFCLPGYACVNNITVMEELVPVYACGAGSISKNIVDGVITRYASPKDVKLYLDEFAERLERKIAFFSENTEK